MHVVLKYIIAQGRLMGSRKWGGVTRSSDWDIAMPLHAWHTVMSTLDKRRISYTFDNGTSCDADAGTNRIYNVSNVHFVVAHEVVNVIVYAEETWAPACMVLDAMDQFADTDLGVHTFVQKHSRILMMETLWSLFFFEYTLDTPVSMFHGTDVIIDDEIPF